MQELIEWFDIYKGDVPIKPKVSFIIEKDTNLLEKEKQQIAKLMKKVLVVALAMEIHITPKHLMRKQNENYR